MTIVINGTTGISDVDGTAAAPALTGTDTNTGIFFPAADTIAFAEGGVEAVRINSSGNVGIGTSSPAVALDLTSGATGETRNSIRLGYGRPAYPTDAIHQIQATSDNLYIKADTANTIASHIIFENDGTERMRIDSNGKFLVNTTTSLSSSYVMSIVPGVGLGAIIYKNYAGTNTGIPYAFQNTANGTIGYISCNSTSTSYVTSSDYRLKDNIAPMTGALAKVALLKPCTYKWKADGSDGQGFIAHELDEVVPGCVTGEKDAVDAEGKPQYQGIDTSFLVATLTAAIQELKAELDAYKATHP